LNKYEIPADIFHYICSFIAAYPFYFTMRRVCKKWKQELEDVVYDQVKIMDLIPYDYVRRTNETTISYKIISFFCVTKFRETVLPFLIQVFPNVTHLRLRVEDNRYTAPLLAGWQNLQHVEYISLAVTEHRTKVNCFHFHRTNNKLKSVTFVNCSISVTMNSLLPIECTEQIHLMYVHLIHDVLSSDKTKITNGSNTELLKYLHEKRKIPLRMIASRTRNFIDLCKNDEELLRYACSKSYPFTTADFVSVIETPVGETILNSQVDKSAFLSRPCAANGITSLNKAIKARKISQVKYLIECQPEGLQCFLKSGCCNPILQALPIPSIAEYLCSLNPDIIMLGNSSGLIEGEKKELFLFHHLFAGNPTFDALQARLKFLVDRKVSFDLLDDEGNNILHALFKHIHQVSIVLSLLSGNIFTFLITIRSHISNSYDKQICAAEKHVKSLSS
jgi:hypothetical protein